MSGCPGVLELIENARRLRDAGKCHCPCVDDDIPKAEALAAEGKCLGAAAVIKASLRRCDPMESLTGGLVPVTPVYYGD